MYGKIKKKLLIALLVLMALLACITLYLYTLLANNSQEIGTVSVSGLSGKSVDILRDANGIPHIFSTPDEDAYFALGFVHAQDRLWQMEMGRRIASGRLAEIFGAKLAPYDRGLRTLGLKSAAEQDFAALDEQTKSRLFAYANGVNSFLESRKSSLPIEFLLLFHKPEHWTPLDSLGILKLQAFELGRNWQAEVHRYVLINNMPWERIQDIFSPEPRIKPKEITALNGSIKNPDVSLQKLAELANETDLFTSNFQGSNNWVISGAATNTGSPILANDPHLALTNPSVWYLVHISTAVNDLVGASIPGIPAVLLGHNNNIAWGFTNTGADTQDLYREKISQTDLNKYLTPSGYHEFSIRKETIKVRFGFDEIFEVRSTRHGPVVSGIFPLPKGVLKQGEVVALSWVGSVASDLSMQAARKIGSSKSWGEFLTALNDLHSPMQNVLFASVKGDIGFIAAGRVPMRYKENEYSGLAPARGWESRNDWAGFISFDDLPRKYLPSTGWIATANNKITDDGYPWLISTEWAEPYRINRIQELINRKAIHSIEDSEGIQLDIVSNMARRILPLLLVSRSEKNETELSKKAVSLLYNWDGRMDQNNAEPLIFESWVGALTEKILKQKLGDYTAPLRYSRPEFIQSLLSGEGDTNYWCGSSCGDYVTGALNDSIARLQRQFGDDIRQWRWGEAHFARHQHIPFSYAPILRNLFERQHPSSGDAYTVNAARNNPNDANYPLASIHGASFRAIYDLNNLAHSKFIISTGESGNLFSSHNKDLGEKWRLGKYIEIPFDKADLAANLETKKLTLINIVGGKM